jgi:hypothetical protein
MQGFLVGDKPFDLRVSFDIVGSDPKSITNKQTPFLAQLFTREIPIGERSILGTTEPETLIESKTSSYKADLPDVTLSPGIYRLGVWAKLQEIPPISDYIEIPLLQVI